jgi:hypothetical protein
MSMLAKDILTETPDNFYVNHDQTKSITTKYTYHETQNDDSYQTTDQTLVKYKTDDKTLKFKAKGDARKSFLELYENRVKVQ